MLRCEPLELRLALSRYTLTDLGDFDGRAMNDWGEVAGLDAAFHPAVWYQGQVTELPVPDGFANAIPNAINDWGQVAGYGNPSGSQQYDALFWDAQGVVDIGPGRVDSINDLSQMAGQSNNQAAVWSPYRPVDTFGAPFSEAYAINDAGQATGGDNATPYAFIWQAGNLDRLPNPNPTDVGGQGHAINNNGDVAGCVNHLGGVDDAVVWWADGTVQELGDYNSPSCAVGINEQGQVVGIMSAASLHAFIWDSAQGMQDLNNLTDTQGFIIGGAYKITDKGVIFGAANYTRDGTSHTVILTPVRDHPADWLGWALSLDHRHGPTPYTER